MNSKTAIIIRREYLERVSKKSFIITTILMPVFMLALMALPALIAMFSESESRQILVIDKTGVIAPKLENTKTLTFSATDLTVDSARKVETADAVLVIPANTLSGEATMQMFSSGPSSMEVESEITNQVDNIVEQYKLKEYNIADLDNIIKSIHSDVKIQSLRNDEESSESSTMLSYMLGLGLTFFLYMALLLYGQMVMTSIIEEKNNRVLEIVVSSVRPTQLMLGKIVGIGLVAVTQIVIWGALLASMSAFVMPALIPADVTADIAALNAGTTSAESLSTDIEIVQALSVLGNVAYIIELFALLLAFLIGGFLFYAAIFAAIGSAVDNIQDASQLQSVVVIPIILGIILATTSISDPSSQLAVWSSFIPFTSPMVMMARIPFGIPAWEIAVSLVVLYASFLGAVWVAAKIYRVGIFMYGKKPSVKDLVHWINYK